MFGKAFFNASDSNASRSSDSDDGFASLYLKFKPILINDSASPLYITDPPGNPLVEMNKSPFDKDIYDIYVVVFLPHDSVGVGLEFSEDNDLRPIQILGPETVLMVRPVRVNFFYPGRDFPSDMKLDVWCLHWIYKETNPACQGLCIYLDDQDPETSRGTYTTVVRT